MGFRFQRLLALMKKEMLQVWRDPSCILITFVLPVILLFIFGFGLSLDAEHVRLAVVMEDRSPTAMSLWNAMTKTKYLAPVWFEERKQAEELLVNGHVRGLAVIPNDFSQRLHSGDTVSVQLITDGAETNTAAILENYIFGVFAVWAKQQSLDAGRKNFSSIDLQNRVVFNPELKSRYALIPGSIVLIMAMIGTLLTSLVVAREWERGTMEAMLATPVGTMDMLLGKLIPYYVLGMTSNIVCVMVGMYLFQVPFRGSAFALFVISSAFLLASLGMGFFISTLCKNQFLASQLALAVAFLPSYILSGALFEIQSTPRVIQMLSYCFPARYYVTCLQTIFITGDIWTLFFPNILFMFATALLFFIATICITPERLE
ncbi:MAG: ABC transporter permease [Planctomycetaceae bacterium]|jgi:ABC-2 type transport system permease protein|nr:ABC transporter permease [Planctomycetaceae bacterium]